MSGNSFAYILGGRLSVCKYNKTRIFGILVCFVVCYCWALFDVLLVVGCFLKDVLDEI